MCYVKVLRKQIFSLVKHMDNPENLEELYSEMIIDHNKSPKNFGKPEKYDLSAHGHNPLCGDTVTVYLGMDDTQQIIKTVQFDACGCAISIASASMMSEIAKNKKISEFKEIFDIFHDTMRSGACKDRDKIGKLTTFEGVYEYPTRVKCATLCWHTMQAAINRISEPITTE